MTDIEKKALALVNEVLAELAMSPQTEFHRHTTVANNALCRAIEQHEAFKREVSNAIQSCMLGPVAEERLSPFIIAKPDPLVEVFSEMFPNSGDKEDMGQVFRAAIEARGGRIVWEGEQ